MLQYMTQTSLNGLSSKLVLISEFLTSLLGDFRADEKKSVLFVTHLYVSGHRMSSKHVS